MRMLSYAAALVAVAAAAAGIAGLPHATPRGVTLVAEATLATCAPAPSTATSGGTLAVSVPRLTLVRVDDGGDPTAVMTNTEQPPCAGDDFYAVTAAGAHRAPAALVRRVLALHLAGDWRRSGEWHSVTASS